MATVFATFDEYGEDLSVVVIPETINLETVTHWKTFSYAVNADSTSEEDVDSALEILAQCHVIDVKANRAAIQRGTRID